MKKFMIWKKFSCVAVSAMLVLGNYTGGAVHAAQSQLPDAFSGQPVDGVLPGVVAGQPVDSVLPGAVAGQPVDGALPVLPLEAAAGALLTDEELRAYYGDSVFIGDSIMLGFRNYSAKQETFVHDIQFLAVGSYGANNAMKPVKGDNVHPTYKGKKYQLWNAIPLTGKTRAFLLLGMNDIAPLGLEGARDQYKELIDKILETSPELDIHIISVTYTLEGEGKKKLNNTNIAAYNVLLQEMAEENGWGYIDLCTIISDGEGNLAEECCSDGFVHLTKTAYSLWETALMCYANVIHLEEVNEAAETAVLE